VEKKTNWQEPGTVILPNGDTALSNIKLLNWLIREQELGTAEKMIAVVLANHRNNVELTCNPSMETIAKEAGCCRQTVWRAIGTLLKKGIIAIKTEPGQVNHYFFFFDKDYISDLSSFDRGNIDDLPDEMRV